jgi:hypothetical protein
MTRLQEDDDALNAETYIKKAAFLLTDAKGAMPATAVLALCS